MKRHKWFIGLVAMSAVFLATGTILAQDSDSDGFANVIESQSGFSLMNSIKLLIHGGDPGFIGTVCPGAQPDRVRCLDASSPDLFVILIPAASGFSRFPSVSDEADLRGFLSGISNSLEAGGLNVTVHPARQDTDTIPRPREVYGGQNAVAVTENNTEVGRGVPFGYTSMVGTPNDSDDSTVWTMNIANTLCDTCRGSWNGTSCTDWKSCGDSSGAEGNDMLENYIRWVTNHEAGHDVYLARNLGDPSEPEHYPAELQVMMSEAVIYVKREKKFYIPDSFYSFSQTNFHLDGHASDDPYQ